MARAVTVLIIIRKHMFPRQFLPFGILRGEASQAVNRLNFLPSHLRLDRLKKTRTDTQDWDAQHRWNMFVYGARPTQSYSWQCIRVGINDRRLLLQLTESRRIRTLISRRLCD